jgi:2-C-methyl-D-erythritol 4-phosphate cytidylyltransferase
MSLNVSVIIPAAGHGRRFTQHAAGPSKIEWPLAGKPVLLHAADLFLHRDDVGQLIIAVPPDQLDHFRDTYADRLGWLGGTIVAGGTIERWETVQAALQHVSEQASHIAVHDAARPLTSQALIDRVFAAARHYHAAIAATPVHDTLKRIEPDEASSETGPSIAETTGDTQQSDAAETDPLDALLGGAQSAGPPAVQRIIETVPRRHMLAAQTPQVFEAGLLRRAYDAFASAKEPANATDDASLVQALGEPVYAVEGESTNFKLTHPADAELAQALLEKRSEPDPKRQPRKVDDADEDEMFG